MLSVIYLLYFYNRPLKKAIECALSKLQSGLRKRCELVAVFIASQPGTSCRQAPSDLIPPVGNTPSVRGIQHLVDVE
jgi:hypothetical protein